MSRPFIPSLFPEAQSGAAIPLRIINLSSWTASARLRRRCDDHHTLKWSKLSVRFSRECERGATEREIFFRHMR